MTMAQGGHSGAVQCLVPIGQFLFSADWSGDIKVSTATLVSLWMPSHLHALPLLEEVLVNCGGATLVSLGMPSHLHALHQSMEGLVNREDVQNSLFEYSFRAACIVLVQ